jgi:hypothetical protein
VIGRIKLDNEFRFNFYVSSAIMQNLLSVSEIVIDNFGKQGSQGRSDSSGALGNPLNDTNWN